MLRFLADEDFDNDILRGVLRCHPKFDIVRVQDVELGSAEDSQVLEFAARESRLILTHDVNSMIRYAYDRVRAGHAMPGLFAVPQDVSIGAVIDDVLLIAQCSLMGEWEGQVRYLPLR